LNRRLIAAVLSAASVVALTVTPALASARAHGTGGFTGAGSTADAPLFSAVFNGYCGSPGCINYSSLGSGTGQKDLNAANVDFGCFDVPMLKTDGFSNLKKIVQFPVALFGESVIYHLDGYTKPLKLTGTLLADIYESKIKMWDDKALVHYNPGLKKFHDPIVPVVRSDSSGTTYNFSAYLSAVSKSFVKTYGGASKTPPWPKSFPGGKGNSGVAGVVHNTPNSIGYAETTYFQLNKSQFTGEAFMLSKDKTWLQPTNKTVASDASHIGKISATHFAIPNAPGAYSYPISAFSWCGVYANYKDNPGTTDARAKATIKFFKWEVATGEEKYGPALTYPKFPKNISQFALKELAKVKA